jgi:hypothetical protein
MTGDLTVRISRAGVERLADLQPLWESLSEHHATVAPDLQALGPLRSPADSWAVRRDLYVELLGVRQLSVGVLAANVPERR